MTPFNHHRSHWGSRIRARQQGFSLLESLIALLIFAVGILGLIGLQTAVTLTQTEMRTRSEAASLAQEMLALMWTDLGRIDQYVITANDGCTAQACQSWLSKVRTTLPNGNARSTAALVEDANNNRIGSEVDLTVTWQMPNGDQRRYQTATSIIRGAAP